MADTVQDINLVARNSIREFYPGTYGGFIGDGIGLWYGSMGSLLPQWGSVACDRMLRQFDYAQHNALWAGAKSIWKQQFLSTPYEISGGRNATYKWQDIFFEADFGEGYDFMMEKALDDLLVTNRGMFLEIVSYGNPDEPLKSDARVLGLNHLDALRIYFTGNREYPYVYYSEVTNEPHRLHYTRVIHLAYNPSADTKAWGIGKSPLYDAMTTVNAQILLGRHQNELLSDLPPPGIILFENIRGEDVQAAMRMFEQQKRRDGEAVYSAPLQLEGKNPEAPAKMTFVPLATVPPDFDYEKYMRTHVNLLALNLQLDPQDVWPLTGQALGTGTQSKILATKTQNKGPGYWLTRMTREWNKVLPRSLEWKYKAPNAEQDLQTAQIAQTWMTGIIVPGVTAGTLTHDEARQLLANQVPAYADVLLDESGNLVRLPDADPKDETQAVIAVDDLNALLPAVQTQQQPPAQATPAESPVNDDETKAPDDVQVQKDFADTSTAFTDDIATILKDAESGSINKASFAARMRYSLKTYGKAAYLDGLNTGGVEADSLDTADSESYAGILADQSQYVTDLASTIYREDGTVAGGPDFKAGLWANKSLTPFYNAGLVSADKNGMYQWNEGDTVDKCKDCLKMDGQVHRLKEYKERDLMPPSHLTKCEGWQCQCTLSKTSGRSKGSWF